MLAQTTIDNQVLKEQFRAFLEEHLADYLAEYVKVNELRLREFSLIERIVRVEQELKSLREIEAERHESLLKEMCARFETQQRETNSLFDLINTRFEALLKEMNTRFESQQQEMNARFETLEKRFSFMQWLIASGIAIIALLVAYRPIIS